MGAGLMTGFLVIALALLWAGLCAWLAHHIGEFFVDSPVRLELKVVIFLALLPIVLVDELLAKPQFDELCNEKARVALHADRLRGRSSYATELPPEPIPGTLVPIHMHRRLFMDSHSHQALVSVTFLRASGGKLARVLPGQGASPLTFRGQCTPLHWKSPFAALGLRLTQPHDEAPPNER